MILDGLLQFSNSQDLSTLAAGSYASTNIIDLHMAGLPVLASGQGARDLGIGDDPALKLLVQVSLTFTSSGATTLGVNIQGAPDNGSGAPGTYTTWWSSPAYALGTLIAGARLLDMDLPRPPAGIYFPRFLRLQYVIGAATATAGMVSSYIVLDRFDQPLIATAVSGGYPAGITIAN
jgi:hypothetical protein